MLLPLASAAIASAAVVVSAATLTFGIVVSRIERRGLVTISDRVEQLRRESAILLERVQRIEAEHVSCLTEQARLRRELREIKSGRTSPPDEGGQGDG